jgi:hypothetical protein
MVLVVPEWLPWVEAVPLIRPVASRNVVRPPPPAVVCVVNVPVIRPEASRMTARSVPPDCFWRSIVWTIRPEASRTTSRQVWAGETATIINETAISPIFAFMQG